MIAPSPVQVALPVEIACTVLGHTEFDKDARHLAAERSRPFAMLTRSSANASLSSVASSLASSADFSPRLSSGFHVLSRPLVKSSELLPIDPYARTPMERSYSAPNRDEEGYYSDVRETHLVKKGTDFEGKLMINDYVRLQTLGAGVHGKVWLCEHAVNKEFVAIKVVARESKNRSLRRAQFEHEDDDPHATPTRTNSRRRGVIMDDKVRTEIAILKRCRHPRVVQLKEVINDERSKKIFMALEYMPGGPIEWEKPGGGPALTVDATRRAFRDVLSGLDYLHRNGIIHRDIKPANLLCSEDLTVTKISDFGVSYMTEVVDGHIGADKDAAKVDDRALRKTAGSPAFFAPELCQPSEGTPASSPTGEADSLQIPPFFRRNSSIHTIRTISHPLPTSHSSRMRKVQRPVIGKAIDVWALGVTLYCLLFGRLPFWAEKSREYDLYNNILTKEVQIPRTMGADNLLTGSFLEKNEKYSDAELEEGRQAIDLLSKLLKKDPLERITLEQAMRHPWVLRDSRESQEWLSHSESNLSDAVMVTSDEVQHATATRDPDAQIPSHYSMGGAIKRFTAKFRQTAFPKRLKRNQSQS